MNKLFKTSAIAACLSMSILTSCTDKNSSSGNGGDMEKKIDGSGETNTNGGTDYNSTGGTDNNNTSNATNGARGVNNVNNGADSIKSR